MYLTKSKQGGRITSRWTFLDPQTASPELFGLEDILALKVKRHTGDQDVRTVRVYGWRTFAEFTDRDPKTGEELEMTKWFIFAAK